MRTRFQRTFSLAIWGFLLGGWVCFADTNVCGDINTTTTWTTAASPYAVTCDVYVRRPNSGAPIPTLTVQPGVTIKFNPGTRLLIGYGEAGVLQALGSASQLIDFTANGTPTAGFWAGIRFYGGAGASKISYATIHWAGTGSQGSVHFEGSSATLENVTVRDGLYSAVSIFQGSPLIKLSTLRGHPVGLLTQTFNSSPSLDTVSIISNTGFAMSFDPRTTLGAVTALTVNTNGTNAVELRCPNQGIDKTTTWKKLVVPYVVTGGYGNVAGPVPSPILTIEAGTTVKFSPGTSLLVGYGYTGELQAVGTSANRIDFTSSLTSPGLGSWGGLQFASLNSTNSMLKYVKVRYGGSGGYGVSVVQTSLTFDHVIFDSNASTAVSTFQANVTVQKCDFTSNGSGIQNGTPATHTVIAKLNWWNSANGPSAGQTVSGGVLYEPWLTAAESAPAFFTGASHQDRTFNPSIGNNTQIGFTTATSAAWTVKFINSALVVVRQFTGTGASGSVSWNGQNGINQDQPNGTYTYTLDSTGAAQAKGMTIIDRTKAVTVSGVTVSEPFFSPNASPGIKDTTSFSASLNFDQASWTIEVKNSVGAVVRTATGTGALILFVWNGKDSANGFVPLGLYTFALSVTVGSSSGTAAATTTVDNTLPQATVTAPTAGQALSNIYQSGVTLVTITGTASDLNMQNWQLVCPYCSGTGTANVTSGPLGTWQTADVANGPYSVVLEVWDKAGNYKAFTVPVTVGNFKVDQNVIQVNGAAGGTVTYTSTVPFSLTETVVIKNEADSTVRTLVNAVARTAGTYADVWNGKGPPPTNSLLPDGGYFYVATVTAGGYTLTWDLRNQYLSAVDVSGQTFNSNFDPFNNLPMTINYNFGRAGRTYIGFNATGPDVVLPCQEPITICPVNGRYEDSGPHTFVWAGVDPTGRYRPEAHGVRVINRWYTMPKSAVVLFGTMPSVSSVSVTPPFYGPYNGSQTIGYILATYQSQTATVTITVLNQVSLTTLRTITLSSQTPGSKTTTWNGKADNGMWVAPGTYLITVKVTDSIGNQAIGQIMTTIQY